jgi:hypothetical protein
MLKLYSAVDKQRVLLKASKVKSGMELETHCSMLTLIADSQVFLAGLCESSSNEKKSHAIHGLFSMFKTVSAATLSLSTELDAVKREMSAMSTVSTVSMKLLSIDTTSPALPTSDIKALIGRNVEVNAHVDPLFQEMKKKVDAVSSELSSIMGVFAAQNTGLSNLINHCQSSEKKRPRDEEKGEKEEEKEDEEEKGEKEEEGEKKQKI